MTSVGVSSFVRWVSSSVSSSFLRSVSPPKLSEALLCSAVLIKVKLVGVEAEVLLVEETKVDELVRLEDVVGEEDEEVVGDNTKLAKVVGEVSETELSGMGKTRT